MTSDVNGTVVGIEGIPVSATTPTTGQVMQFNGTEWVPANFPTIQSQTFLTDGYWTCPAGVNTIMLQGCGGGGGGGSQYGNGDQGAASAGGGSLLNTIFVSVIPETEYTITIGAGGSGGIGGATGNNGSNGDNTTFGDLATFYGGSYGVASANEVAPGGGTMPNTFGYHAYGINGDVYNSLGLGCGGDAQFIPYNVSNGQISAQGFAGGNVGVYISPNNPGSGGGGGPYGVGGAGGDAPPSSGDPGGNGGSAANNSGAGGGGASAGGSSSSYGNGGDGGSGQLSVFWIA